MNKIIYLAILSIAITSCGGGGGGGSSDKNLFSLWNRTTDNSPLVLTGGEFSTNIGIAFFFAGGAQCNCDFSLLGTQSSGTYIVNSCFYKTGSGSGDPGCNALNQTGVYAKSSNTLTITGPNGSSSYK